MERYKQECKKINEQINPSDEFIQNLKTNLNKKVTEEKMKRKYYFSKVAMIFCTLTLVSTGVFAKDIGNWLAQLFSNTDESVQMAVENGFVQNVEMDYIENDGIAIKVNSLVIDNNKMNVVFDVKGEIDGKLAVKNLELKFNDEIYDNTKSETINILFSQNFKSINKNTHYIIIDISNIEKMFEISDKIEIELLDSIIMEKENAIKNVDGKWKFNVIVEQDNFKTKVANSEINYIVEENKYLEDYKISVNNTGTNIQLSFKKDFDKYNLMEKKNIYIETLENEKIYCRDFGKFENNKIKLSIPITSNDNVEEFKIILNLENEEICLKVKSENS